MPAIERADYDDSADALTNADIEPLTADEIFEPSRSRERKK